MKYFFYFMVGGIVVSSVTYLAGHARGLLAAFIANMPTITVLTFVTIYLESGPKAVVPYALGLVVMLVPWFAYIFSVIFLTPRMGFVPSLFLGVALYFLLAMAIFAVRRFWIA